MSFYPGVHTLRHLCYSNFAFFFPMIQSISFLDHFRFMVVQVDEYSHNVVPQALFILARAWSFA